jgi:hypothetical protein
VRSGVLVVVRCHGVPPEPDACADGEQHDEEQQSDPSAPIPPPPAPSCDRRQNVQRHGSMLAG